MTIIFLTASYCQHIDFKLLREKYDLRVVLLTEKNISLSRDFLNEFDRVERLSSSNHDVRPILNFSEALAICSEESIASRGEITIVCQEESNLLLAAKLREILDLAKGDRPNIVNRFRNKLLMKQALKPSGIKMPEYQAIDKKRLSCCRVTYFNELAQNLGIPFIVKPVDSAGSFGVEIIREVSDFYRWAQDVQDSVFEYEADEFIPYPMGQVDSIVVDGEIVFEGVLELNCTNFQFVQGTPLAARYVDDPNLKAKMSEMNRKVIKALGLKNGCSHHEMFINPETKEVTFLEIACRVPGGMIIPIHRSNTGVNFMQVHVESLIDERFRFKQGKNKGTNVYAMLPVESGTISNLVEPDLESRYSIDWKVKVGDRVSANSVVDTAGILHFYNDDIAALHRDYDRLSQYKAVVCE